MFNRGDTSLLLWYNYLMANRKNNSELIKKFRATLKKINRDLDKVQETISCLCESEDLNDLEQKLNDI
jgi:hypothetical protein